MFVGGGTCNPDDFSRIFEREASEVSQLNEFRGLGIFGFETSQRFVNIKQLFDIRLRANIDTIQLKAFAAVSFDRFLLTGLIDEDAAHRLGSRTKEMGLSVPIACGNVSDQAKIRFVDESGRLERMTRRFRR